MSKATEHVAGRGIPVLSANILGGGSSVNFMMYARPLISEMDGWNTEGWKSRDLIPLLNRVREIRVLPFSAMV